MEKSPQEVISHSCVRIFTFYGNLRFITVLSPPQDPILLHLNPVLYPHNLPFHVHLGLSNELFLSDFFFTFLLLSPPTCIQHVLLISFSFVWSS